MPARSVCMVTTLTGVAWMCPESVCILTKAKFSSVGQSIQTFPGGAIVCTCTSSTVLVTDPSPHGFVLPVNVWVAVHMQACDSFPQPKGEPGDGDLHLYVGQTCNMPLARESNHALSCAKVGCQQHICLEGNVRLYHDLTWRKQRGRKAEQLTSDAVTSTAWEKFL